MPRVKRGFNKHRRHKGVLHLVKGQRNSRGHLYRTALEAKMRSLAYAYRDRRNRKRDMRALWITRINAAARQHGLPYNRFIAGLARLGITLDRKVLADMAVTQPLAFATLAYQVRGEAMPDDVRARYTPVPAPVVTRKVRPPTRPPAPAGPAPAAAAEAPDAEEAEDTAPLDDIEAEADDADADAAEADEVADDDADEAEGEDTGADEPDGVPTMSLAEEEAEASGNPPEQDGTANPPAEEHDDPQQGPSR